MAIGLIHRDCRNSTTFRSRRRRRRTPHPHRRLQRRRRRPRTRHRHLHPLQIIRRLHGIPHKRSREIVIRTNPAIRARVRLAAPPERRARGTRPEIRAVSARRVGELSILRGFEGDGFEIALGTALGRAGIGGAAAEEDVAAGVEGATGGTCGFERERRWCCGSGGGITIHGLSWEPGDL